ncbi:hypothetical protein EVAR_22972_1 [Eumeta japonica]|uniref:Uncharacterized protein n=1 Tax=Eumeta variegata TaxID=151549 RepID=A0A4C1UQA4_EUMVA|nr:hypothetical protein EVAR_22972_1 [Eumeta japonica]
MQTHSTDRHGAHAVEGCPSRLADEISYALQSTFEFRVEINVSNCSYSRSAVTLELESSASVCARRRPPGGAHLGACFEWLIKMASCNVDRAGIVLHFEIFGYTHETSVRECTNVHETRISA